MTVFSSGTALTPSDAERSFSAGVSLALRGRWKQAIVIFDRLCLLDPTALAFNARGRCRRRLHDLKGALRDFDHAIRLEPAFAEAYRNRGNALLELQRYRDAIADLERAVTLAPSSAMAANNRGFAFRLCGEFERALNDHTRAVELDPTYAEAFRDRAAALRDLGRAGDADLDLARAAGLDAVLDLSKLTTEAERRKLAGVLS